MLLRFITASPLDHCYAQSQRRSFGTDTSLGVPGTYGRAAVTSIGRKYCASRSWSRKSVTRRSRNAEASRHVHQVGERSRLHFPHHLATVRLHRDLADSELSSDLLVQQARDDQRHDFSFT